MEVFASKGYHGCRISDVAKQAGVAYGLVYHYFRNKEELLESVYAESFGRFAEVVLQVVEQEGTVAQKLERIVETIIQAYVEDPKSVQVLLLDIARSPAFRDARKITAMQQVLEAIAKMIARGQRNGEVRADVMPFIAACALSGAVEIMLTTFVLGAAAAQTPEGIQKAKQDVLAIFLSGLAPTKSPAKPVAVPSDR